MKNSQDIKRMLFTDGNVESVRTMISVRTATTATSIISDTGKHESRDEDPVLA